MNIQISGNLSGPTAIFIAGWPDTSDVFRDNIMATLAPDYRIVGITLPGFDDEHPFLQALRDKGMSSSLGGLHSEGGAQVNPPTPHHDHSWLPNIFPFSCFKSDKSAAAQAAQSAAAQRACLVNTLRVAGGQPPLEPLRTTWKGHSFQDLVTMLEIAVDTAMETCNYCPSTIPSTAATAAVTASGVPGGLKDGAATGARTAATAARDRHHSSERQEEGSEDGVDAVPLHQLPPTYTRPVLIAHDWGCFLAYELLLIRPDFFSRFVALDLGMTVFEKQAGQVERMCALVSRNERSRVAASMHAASSPPRTPGVLASSLYSESPQLRSPLNGRGGPAGSPLSRDAPTTVEGNDFPRRNTHASTAKRPNLSASGRSGKQRFSDAADPALQPRNSRSNSLHETPISSPVTVVHGLPAGSFANSINNNNNASVASGAAGFEAGPQAVSNTSQLRHSISGATTKRSLASQYAIRRKKPTPQTQRTERLKLLAIVLYQGFLIACTVVVPTRLARWLVGCFASFIGRPSYCFDPQVVSTPTVELLNHTLNAQFFAQHPYAIENRAAFDLPVLLQVQEGANLSSRMTEASFPSINLEHPSLMRSKQPPRLLPGWKFMLLPYIEGTPLPSELARRHEHATARGSAHAGGVTVPLSPLSRHDHADNSSLPVSGVAGKRLRGAPSRTRRTSSPSDQSRRYSLYHASSTSTDFSQDDLSSPLHAGATEEGEERETSWNEASAASSAAVADPAYTIYSSYAKGAGLFEEWSAPVENLGRVNASAGTSGELDPYFSAQSIPSPLYAAEDPLSLTGAQSFQEPRRGGTDYFLIAPDRDAASWRSATAATTTAAASPHMQVVKRKIFYQAIAFPPLAPPKNASSSSLTGDVNNAMNNSSLNNNNNNNDDAMSSRSAHSTVLDRLRRSHRKAALRPSVPVLATPQQGYVYLRYWLGMLLMAFMTFAMWLFGEKKRAAPPSSGDGSDAGNNAGSYNSATAANGAGSGVGNNNNNSSSKAYSNVMTTAMTTIYRRLPAPPPLAASTTNLPGDGDVVLQPVGYSPLVSQRYFVPLSVPVLFMYGGAKKVMLHADHWCAYVRQYQRPRDGISDVVDVQGGGHWFFAEKKYQKKVADRIAEFLAAEQKSPLGV